MSFSCITFQLVEYIIMAFLCVSNSSDFFWLTNSFSWYLCLLTSQHGLLSFYLVAEKPKHKVHLSTHPHILGPTFMAKDFEYLPEFSYLICFLESYTIGEWKAFLSVDAMTHHQSRIMLWYNIIMGETINHIWLWFGGLVHLVNFYYITFHIYLVWTYYIKDHHRPLKY